MNWEERLNGVLKDAAGMSFDPKNWNCAYFAHACATAILGRSLPSEWQGSLEQSVDATGLARIPCENARRGDVVLADVPEPSLGVCIGAKAAFLGPRGLCTVRMRRAKVVWAVD